MAMQLKFYEGAQPGKHVKKEKIGDSKKVKKAYEDKRDREFQDSWRDKRPWLVYDHEKYEYVPRLKTNNLSFLLSLYHLAFSDN